MKGHAGKEIDSQTNRQAVTQTNKSIKYVQKEVYLPKNRI